MSVLEKMAETLLVLKVLTIRLDEKEEVGVAPAPLAEDDVRLQLRLELDALRVDVPDQ